MFEFQKKKKKSKNCCDRQRRPFDLALTVLLLSFTLSGDKQKHPEIQLSVWRRSCRLLRRVGETKLQLQKHNWDTV